MQKTPRLVHRVSPVVYFLEDGYSVAHINYRHGLEVEKGNPRRMGFEHRSGRAGLGDGHTTTAVGKRVVRLEFLALGRCPIGEQLQRALL